jgi:hypothetical protein
LSVAARDYFFNLAKSAGSIVVTLVALAVAIWLVDWRQLLEAASRISPVGIVTCLALALLSHLLLALRWSLIATPRQTLTDQSQATRQRVDLWRYGLECLVYLHASLFNLITPAALGADVHRIVRGRGRAGGRQATAGFVVLERVLGVSAQAAVFVTAYAACKWFDRRDGLPMPPVFFVSALAMTSVLAMMFLGVSLFLLWARAQVEGRKHRVLEGLQTVAQAIRTTPLRFAMLFFLSIAAVASWIAAATPLVLDTALALSPFALAMVVILTEFSRLIPISLQGIGVREGTFALLTADLGADAAAGFTVCALLYLLNYVMVGGMGVAAGTAIESIERKSMARNRTARQSATSRQSRPPDINIPRSQ